jgi:hypothetical protein
VILVFSEKDKFKRENKKIEDKIGEIKTILKNQDDLRTRNVVIFFLNESIESKNSLIEEKYGLTPINLSKKNINDILQRINLSILEGLSLASRVISFRKEKYSLLDLIDMIAASNEPNIFKLIELEEYEYVF